MAGRTPPGGGGLCEDRGAAMHASTSRAALTGGPWRAHTWRSWLAFRAGARRLGLKLFPREPTGPHLGSDGTAAREP